MPVHLLGPVSLLDEAGGEVPVTGGKRQAVLALLAFHEGRTVSLEQLYAFLWGDEPPAQAKAVIQGHVAALRKLAAGLGFSIETRAGGYALRDESPSDARTFTTLVERSRTSSRGDAELLRRALSLWRGSALAGLGATPMQRALATELEEQRVRALEDWAAIELDGGDVDAVLVEMQRSIRVHSMREPLVALYMRCLHQAGRAAEALEVFDFTKNSLAEAFGVDPGAALEQASALVRGQSAPPAVSSAVEWGPPLRHDVPESGGMPNQLPRMPVGFVGRSQELAKLEAIAAQASSGAGQLAVVCGAGGVGKTALTIRWARSAGGRFPDGQLFVDLRGVDQDAADAETVLGTFLTTLGVDEQEIPDGHGPRAELFAQTTQRLRLLVVLDNARDARQIEGLIAQGPRCMTVVTSRNTLADLLVSQGAGIVVVGPLPQADAMTLLANLIGHDRTEAEREAAEQITGFCDQLPLALRLCGARLPMRPSWRLDEMVRELADERVRLAALDGDAAASGVEVALSLTRRLLSPDGSRLLALLGAHPGPNIDAWAAAALLDVDVTTARRALGSLAGFHLTDETAPGRHRRHDLVRAYCGQLFHEELDAGQRRAAIERLLGYYLEACSAHQDSARSTAWFRCEEPALRLLLAEHCEGGYPDQRLWEIAWDLMRFCYYEGRTSNTEPIATHGLRAAEQADSAVGIARMLSCQAVILIERRDYPAALEILRRADREADRSGDADCRGIVKLRLAICLEMLDLNNEAQLVYQQTLDVGRELGDAHLIKATLLNLADALIASGDPAGALPLLAEILELSEGTPPDVNRVLAFSTQAQAFSTLGRVAEAIVSCRAAIDVSREIHAPRLEAGTTANLAALFYRQGDRDEAVVLFKSAIELCEENQQILADIQAQLDIVEAGGELPSHQSYLH